MVHCYPCHCCCYCCCCGQDTFVAVVVMGCVGVGCGGGCGGRVGRSAEEALVGWMGSKGDEGGEEH